MKDIYNPCQCLHPIALDVHGQKIVVPCGKCYICQINKDEMYKHRCIEESKFHRYCWQVTLTYDNEHCPSFLLCDLFSNFSKSELKGIKTLKRDNTRVGVLCKEDVQKFMKRLRINLLRSINKTNKTINQYKDEKQKRKIYKCSELGLRYFCVGEYGPHTLRPHYHILLWFDLPEIITYLRACICKSWKMCDKNRLLKNEYSGLVNSNAAEYISGYLTSSVNLPLFYQLSNQIKPFRLSSSFPAIGFYKVPDEEIKESFLNGTFTTTSINESTRERISIPFSKYIVHRFFPKCKGYSTSSIAERFDIYKNSYSTVKRTFDTLLTSGDLSLCKDFAEVYGISDEYSTDLAERDKVIDKNSYRYEFRKKHNIELNIPVKYLNWQNYRASRAAHIFCNKYNISLNTYLTQLDKLYKSRESASFSKFYKQQEYIRYDNPSAPLDWWYCYDILRGFDKISPETYHKIQARHNRADINFDLYYLYDIHSSRYRLKHNWLDIFINQYSKKNYDDDIIRLTILKKLSKKLHNSLISSLTNKLDV